MFCTNSGDIEEYPTCAIERDDAGGPSSEADCEREGCPANSQGSSKCWEQPIQPTPAHRPLRLSRKLRRPVKPHTPASSCPRRGSGTKTPVETRKCQRGAYVAHAAPKSGAAYLHIVCADSAQRYVADFDAKSRSITTAVVGFPLIWMRRRSSLTAHLGHAPHKPWRASTGHTGP